MQYSQQLTLWQLEIHGTGVIFFVDEAKTPFGIPFLQNARGALWCIAQVPGNMQRLCRIKRSSVNRKKPLKTSDSPSPSLSRSSAFWDAIPCWPIS